MMETCKKAADSQRPSAVVSVEAKFGMLLKAEASTYYYLTLAQFSGTGLGH